jgi:hypothetical protein
MIFTQLYRQKNDNQGELSPDNDKNPCARFASYRS